MHPPPASQVPAPPPVGDRTDLLFYDGRCGLCHGVVRFVIARDRAGTRFRFAPLQGETFGGRYPQADRAELPDSVVLRTGDGRTLVRSRALLQIGERLGGVWRGLARAAGLLPVWLLDWGYDGIARVRHHLFARPDASCPALPPELRGRFLP
jgi:predicted DCC family thiol-disulfide oxidoreductase YuxK